MQSIADLTQVLREVVSMCRIRSAGSEHPFPPSLSSRELVFEAGQVAAWLEATGRGNNPDAPLEGLLHSSQFDELLEDLDASSTLLLIHDLIGGPLSALSDTRPLADSFRSLSSKLDRAWALAAGHQDIQTLLPEVQFYKEVRVWMAKYDAQERLSRGEPVTDEVRRLLGDLLVGSAEAAGVVDIYDEAGLGLQRLDAITPTWIDEAKKPSKSQLAIESLKATILEEVARVTGGNEV